ncbi:hypothetical protein [Moorena sp. SIO3I8]|uniref:hypothetical protein n=1 Tax=Moorena sp. SIO3I8 TaxID=2607833 RepID=UPI0025E17235|nr:hypothetical protein [Moorena sp. SIO3I8]
MTVNLKLSTLNFQPWPLATLREQPWPLATLREQPWPLATLREQPSLHQAPRANKLLLSQFSCRLHNSALIAMPCGNTTTLVNQRNPLSLQVIANAIA